jgi:hypothetical protein
MPRATSVAPRDAAISRDATPPAERGNIVPEPASDTAEDITIEREPSGANTPHTTTADEPPPQAAQTETNGNAASLAEVWNHERHAGLPDDAHDEFESERGVPKAASAEPHAKPRAESPPPLPRAESPRPLPRAESPRPLPRAGTPPPIPRARSQPAPQEANIATHLVRTQPANRRWLSIGIGVVVLAGVGIGGWQLWLFKNQEPADKVAIANKPSGDKPGSGAQQAVSLDAAAAVATAEDAAVAPAAADAGVAVAAVADASVAAPATADPGAAQPSDSLQIASTPPGARVFIDGADQGLTPVKVLGSGDRHTMALFLAGHELYVAEVPGHGAFQIALKPVIPMGGPAGIKVIKCKGKDRVYVSVDGKPTGMTCPTERIGCGIGPHTVEVYDIVSDTHQKFEINVTDTRLSYRVRVE